MTSEERPRYEFAPGLPVPGVRAGTNLLVSGPATDGAREIALDLLTTGSRREGVLLLSADGPADALLARVGDLPQPIDRSMLGIVDCSDRDEEARSAQDDPTPGGGGPGGGDREARGDDRRFAAHAAPIAGPGDLGHIEVEFSLLYEKIRARDADGVRIGLFSLSALLEYAELRDVSRFLHVLTGRIIATDDLGVFLIDSTRQDERTVETLGRFCDGHVEVRPGDTDRLETRVTGLSDQPAEWAPVEYEVPSLAAEDSPAERG